MQTIAIDPFLLHFDEPCRTEEDLRAFLNGILSWSSAIRREDTIVTMSDSVKNALFQDDIYPHDQRVHTALLQFGIDDVDPRTVFGLTRTLIERSLDPEAVIGINAVSYDGETISVEPDHLMTRLSKRTRPAFEESLITIGCHNQFGEEETGFIIASRGNNGDANESFPMRVSCKIEEISPVEILTQASVVAPFQLDEDFSVYSSFNALLGDLDSVDALQEPITVQSVKDIIDAKVMMHIANGVQPIIPRKNFSIGTHFIESLRRWGFSRRRDLAEIVIDACARICLDVPRKPVLEFRETDDIHSPQVVRADGALAWRTHLTKHSAGYRLMLWTIGPDHFEFANVGPKKEEIIL